MASPTARSASCYDAVEGLRLTRTDFGAAKHDRVSPFDILLENYLGLRPRQHSAETVVDAAAESEVFAIRAANDRDHHHASPAGISVPASIVSCSARRRISGTEGEGPKKDRVQGVPTDRGCS
jgi:hypothetical protein